MRMPKTKSIPLYYDLFVIFGAVITGLFYGSFYKYPGAWLGLISGGITGFAWCWLIRLCLIKKSFFLPLIPGLFLGISSGLFSTFIINTPVFFGIEQAYKYCLTDYVSMNRESFVDVELISSPFITFFAGDAPSDYMSRAFWTGGVAGGYLGLICGGMFGLANKLRDREKNSKNWPTLKLDIFYCVTTSIILGVLLMGQRPCVKYFDPGSSYWYFFMTFPLALLIFSSWTLLKRFVCRRVNLWPFMGVLPIYIIDNAFMVIIFLICIHCSRLGKTICESLILGGTIGLFWGLIFAVHKKLYDRRTAKLYEVQNVES